MIIYTIGFTKTTAKSFFDRLRASGATSILDVRLKADSQLSGFAKKSDISYFSKAILGIEYAHGTILAPTESMLNMYKKRAMDWETYSKEYIKLIQSREVERILSPQNIDGTCFLCSEDTPHKCHRRLAAEYLAKQWDTDVSINHL